MDMYGAVWIGHSQRTNIYINQPTGHWSPVLIPFELIRLIEWSFEINQKKKLILAIGPTASYHMGWREASFNVYCSGVTNDIHSPEALKCCRWCMWLPFQMAHPAWEIPSIRFLGLARVANHIDNPNDVPKNPKQFAFPWVLLLRA